MCRPADARRECWTILVTDDAQNFGRERELKLSTLRGVTSNGIHHKKWSTENSDAAHGADRSELPSMKSFIVLCLFVGIALGATQTQKGTPVKQRKPSLPKKYIVEDGGYVKHRKVRSVGILSQYELRERHRIGRQLPGLRNGGGGYLYSRPIYTPSDHLDARPALPLAEVESHPLSNFPAHYSGDLEDVPKEVKKEEKKAEIPPPAAETPKKDMEDKKREDTPMKKTEAPKTEGAVREKSEAPPVTKAPTAAPAKTTPRPVSEAPTKKKEEHIQITQQETVSGKPPVAVE